MPQNNREYLLRFADHAINDMERALYNLGLIRNVYAGANPDASEKETADANPLPINPERDHPEHRQAIEQIGVIIANAHELLTYFRQNIM